MNDKNKKLDGISHGKAVRRTTPLIASQPSNSTNVYKDIETTKLKLRNLAERWVGVNKIRGFLTELWETLGINKGDNKQQKGGNPSRYAAFILQDGTILTITIRASAHNARAKNYLKKGNVNGDINLSIVLQKRRKKNRFEPNKNVRLIEYVYLEDRISDIENPLSQIAMSLVGYLTNGQYIDTTGVAILNPKTEQIKEEYKTNKDMNKNRIKITENELKQIVAESVKKVLKESYNDDDIHMSNYNDAMSDMYESLSVDSILRDLKYEGGVDLGECPHIWAPANWEDVLQYATEFGYNPEEVRECILKDLNSESKWIQKSIDAVKNWRFQE